MFFFKSKYEHELDEIIREIDMNMSNNYKDAAQQNLVRLEMRFNEMVKDGLCLRMYLMQLTLMKTLYRSEYEVFTFGRFTFGKKLVGIRPF